MTKFIYDYYSLEFLLTFLYEQSFTYFDEVATSIFFLPQKQQQVIEWDFSGAAAGGDRRGYVKPFDVGVANRSGRT